MSVAKPISATDPASQQLTLFFQSLNVQEQPRVYMYKNNAYIRASVLVPVLKVSLPSFMKSSKKAVHYIIIKGETYVNKYGLTKLIASSTVPAAFKLQDYIYEVIYLLETNGTVSKEDVVSRNELISLMSELDTTKIENNHNSSLVDQYRDDLNELTIDYQKACISLRDVTAALKTAEMTIQTLQRKSDKYHEIALQLAKYVKYISGTKSKKTDTVLDELSDISEESDLEDYEREQITVDAVRAKKRLLTKEVQKKRVPIKKNTPESKTTSYYLMRSTHGYMCDRGITYEWKIITELPNCDDPLTVNNQPYDSFKEFSKDYNLGGHETVPFDYIWYMDLNLTDREYKQLSKIISRISIADEISMVDIMSEYY